ncbi:hypothetical protein ACE6H2_016940 [Prunus campanulata]
MNSKCDPPQIFDKSLVEGDRRLLAKMEAAWPNLLTGKKDRDEIQRLPLIRTLKESKNVTSAEYLLWEVIICYDQVGESRIDCPLPPAPESSQSKANILYGKPPQTGKTKGKGEGSDRKKRKKEGKI